MARSTFVTNFGWKEMMTVVETTIPGGFSLIYIIKFTKSVNSFNLAILAHPSLPFHSASGERQLNIGILLLSSISSAGFFIEMAFHVHVALKTVLCVEVDHHKWRTALDFRIAFNLFQLFMLWIIVIFFGNYPLNYCLPELQTVDGSEARERVNCISYHFQLNTHRYG